MNKFIGYLSENIKRESDAAYIKLAQDLSLTIYHLTKDKSYQFQISIIDVFSGLFNDIAAPNLVTQIRSILLNEVNNHISGKSSTFTDLRKKVHLNIENTKLDLMENTYGSIVDPSNNSEVDNIYKFSFLIKTPEKVILRTSNSENLLGSLNLGCNVYMKAAVDVENIKFPLMFAPNMGSSALQWLKLHYARVLGVSPSNEYIYYYFLIDAFIVCGLNKFTDVAELYLKYVCLVLNDIKFGGDIAVVQDIMSMQDVVPFWVVKNAADYSGVGLLPMTIYYLTFRKFIVDLFVDGASKEGYVDKLRGECEKDVREDLLRHGQDLDKLGWDEANLVLKAAVADSCRIKFVLIDEEEKVIIEAHPFGGKTSKIVCPGRLVTTDILCCEICNRAVTPKRLKSCIENVDLLKNIKPSFYTNSTAHIDLGELDGLNKTPLITPDKFTSDFESFSLSNTMIVDPISAAKMRITNNDEFNKEVWFKYPFLKGINMANVALCGGFVRSILLKQQMKDFDFFFYGIKDDYLPRFKSLLTDLTNALTKHDPQMKFGMFYKPMFNVFELIAFKDPSNHINETFTLDNFDKYPFMSLKRYHTDEKIEPDQYYFEDNDEKGVKMKYRFQFIMCKYNAIQDILNSFDLFPSKVAYDGQRVYFTEKSLIAYRYMINEINLYGGSDLIKHRINKYFKYGFSIVFPKNNRKWATADYDNKYHGDENYRGSNENIGPLKFKVRRCIKNIIYINHGSNYENQLERNETLEKEAMGAAKALYISSLFCSFVSVLRYVKINEIPYEFPQFAPSDLIEADQCLMKNGNVTLNFLDRYETLYKEKDWYKQFYKSVKLINFIGT
ncbi:MAG: hypothetical protein Hyperionvirus14_33 [Hyperionvirus sp.]|uniref:Uncharacterized protein n=1 Tax=Hyperionvirus sp. TaxID=2487770 RepID=A0A3G5ABJ4_9VIRU|nr:MAG: hypothetical protein Hyperionvirus14_33 [Hyperionvirus sp.]